MNERLGTVYEVVEGADAEPTPQAIAAFGDARAALEARLRRWADVLGKDLPERNARLSAAGLPPIGDLEAAAAKLPPASASQENEE